MTLLMKNNNVSFESVDMHYHGYHIAHSMGLVATVIILIMSVLTFIIAVILSIYLSLILYKKKKKEEKCTKSRPIQQS
jgi:uncharacterized membrane protein